LIITTSSSVVAVFCLSMCLQHGLFTVVHKHYSPEAWKQFAHENRDALKVTFLYYSSAVEGVHWNWWCFDYLVHSSV